MFQPAFHLIFGDVLPVSGKTGFQTCAPLPKGRINTRVMRFRKEDAMKNTVITVAILAAIGIGGFVWYQNKSEVPVVDVEIPATDAVETPSLLEGAADAVGDVTESVAETVESVVEETADAVEGAADTAAEAMSDVAEEAAEVATEAADAVSDVASDAVEAVEGAADSAMEAAGDVATGAETAVDEAMETATETATESAAEATEATSEAVSEAVEETTSEAAAEVATPEMSAEELLTADGFNAEKIVELIDGSDLGIAQKTVLRSAVEKASDNPELAESVIAQVKQALGL